MSELSPYPDALLPDGIVSRFLPDVNGLSVHILEAGEKGRPLILLLHGYPELAYSWRHVMSPLAEAGFYVVAPDLRGFGRTTGGGDSYDCNLNTYGYLNKVADTQKLVRALGYEHVVTIAGHDLGAPIAAYSALLRPDVFRSVILMSSPFAGPAPLVFGDKMRSLNEDLANLPRPRKHYISWNATREAADNYFHPPQGLHDFFRAYFHSKSADWPGNQPVPLKAGTAEELAQIPTYYIMDLKKGMAETMFDFMPTAEEIAACKWLTDEEVELFANEYGRTGFQAALNAAYRPRTEMQNLIELQAFSGRMIDVPSCFVSGANDWGLYQTYGALENMPVTGCSNFLGSHIVEGAGHWVQQERHQEVSRIILDFIVAAKVGAN